MTSIIGGTTKVHVLRVLDQWDGGDIHESSKQVGPDSMRATALVGWRDFGARVIPKVGPGGFLRLWEEDGLYIAEFKENSTGRLHRRTWQCLEREIVT